MCVCVCVCMYSYMWNSYYSGTFHFFDSPSLLFFRTLLHTYTTVSVCACVYLYVYVCACVEGGCKMVSWVYCLVSVVVCVNKAQSNMGSEVAFCCDADNKVNNWQRKQTNKKHEYMVGTCRDILAGYSEVCVYGYWYLDSLHYASLSWDVFIVTKLHFLFVHIIYRMWNPDCWERKKYLLSNDFYFY